MAVINITTDSGEQHQITTTENVTDPDTIIEAHGFDASSVEYTVTKGTDDRLDDLEDRIEELEGLL